MNPILKISGALVLINFVYGIINLFNLGQFLTLIPLSTFFISIIFGVGAFTLFKSHKRVSFVLIYLSLVFLLQSNAVLELILNSSNLKSLQTTFSPYYFWLEFVGIGLLWVVSILPFVYKQVSNRIFLVIGVVLFLATLSMPFFSSNTIFTFTAFFTLVVFGLILNKMFAITKDVLAIVHCLVLVIVLTSSNALSYI